GFTVKLVGEFAMPLVPDAANCPGDAKGNALKSIVKSLKATRRSRLKISPASAPVAIIQHFYPDYVYKSERLSG
ncbi:hypothetical protein O5833_27330, partial [Escherichia coli]|nr:hypothetical protein [Escherichia coli]